MCVRLIFGLGIMASAGCMLVLDHFMAALAMGNPFRPSWTGPTRLETEEADVWLPQSV